MVLQASIYVLFSITRQTRTISLIAERRFVVYIVKCLRVRGAIFVRAGDTFSTNAHTFTIYF